MPSRPVTFASKLSPRLAGRLLAAAPALDESLQVFRPADEDLATATATVGSPEQGVPVTRWQQKQVSPDGRLASGVWDSTAGTQTFAFEFDEWIHVLEGEAHVTVAGETTVLRAGDAAFFRAGLPMTWVVPDSVRKVWVHRYPRPSLVVRVARKIRSALRAPLQRVGVQAVAITLVLDTSVSCF